MKKEKQIKILIITTTLSVIILAGLINAEQTWPAFNFCCEKTKNGAWCQNTLESNCDVSIDPLTKSPFKKTSTSCEATSFCKQGCCVDSQEGLCMENTPQRVCSLSGGTWVDNSKCTISQCDLGCCILGDQASFVTQTRCKRLSAFYGLETNFKKNIKDEMTCILTTQMQDKGACVFELEFQRTCKFTTREQCSQIKGNNITSAVEFFKDFLCSADELATNCGPTTETLCIDGRDEVYFKDSCGNPANIYDSSRIKDPAYWKKIIQKANSCEINNEKGNAESRICGNCDYFKGSVCGKGVANYGDYVCRDINCYNTENGKDYKNGESWCVYQGNTGNGRDLVGSRHFRHVCINGEETIEPCADFRSEVCIESKIQTSQGDFREAGCRANRWADCTDNDEKEDCMNIDKRDCYWKLGYHFNLAGSTTEGIGNAQTTTVPAKSSAVFEGGAEGSFSGGTTGGFSGGLTGKVVADSSDSGISIGGGSCLPNIPPGLMFWTAGDANTVCSQASTICTVTFEKNLFGKTNCANNCLCLDPAWVVEMNDICTSLGDCGAYVNIAGKLTTKGAEWKIDGEKQLLTGILSSIQKKAGGGALAN